MRIKADAPHVLFEWGRELGKTNALLDFHVHPYDVLSGDTNYKPDQLVGGLFYKNLSRYRPPVIEAERNDIFNTAPPQKDNQRALILAARFTYNHTGPKVFNDQINLIGLTGVVLLPVARTAGMAEQMLISTHAIFQTNDRFLPGCAFPIGIKPGDLDGFFRSAHRKYGIRAIKFHPNLAGIDPLSNVGQESIHSALSIAGELNLPFLVHGGYTPGIEPAESRIYGAISSLSQINWSISKSPVILAHAGCYGLSREESKEALKKLKKMLDVHSNLMIDTSYLESEILRLVLETINPERIIFGSDALYVPIWKGWLRFLHTLMLVSSHPDDDLILIASKNPARCLSF